MQGLSSVPSIQHMTKLIATGLLSGKQCLGFSCDGFADMETLNKSLSKLFDQSFEGTLLSLAINNETRLYETKNKLVVSSQVSKNKPMRTFSREDPLSPLGQFKVNTPAESTHSSRSSIAVGPNGSTDLLIPTDKFKRTLTLQPGRISAFQDKTFNRTDISIESLAQTPNTARILPNYLIIRWNTQKVDMAWFFHALCVRDGIEFENYALKKPRHFVLVFLWVNQPGIEMPKELVHSCFLSSHIVRPTLLSEKFYLGTMTFAVKTINVDDGT